MVFLREDVKQGTPNHKGKVLHRLHRNQKETSTIREGIPTDQALGAQTIDSHTARTARQYTADQGFLLITCEPRPVERSRTSRESNPYYRMYLSELGVLGRHTSLPLPWSFLVQRRLLRQDHVAFHLGRVRLPEIHVLHQFFIEHELKLLHLRL